jgi:hypothetical protein
VHAKHRAQVSVHGSDVWRPGWAGVGGCPQTRSRMPAVPFKAANGKCRHHIPKQKRRLTNWPAYEASLRQRCERREAVANVLSLTRSRAYKRATH